VQEVMNDENDDDDIETMRSSLVEQLQKKNLKPIHHSSLLSVRVLLSALFALFFFFVRKKKFIKLSIFCE